MAKFFPITEKATFLERVNRFTIKVLNRHGKVLKSYLPNSGSLEELLIPGRTVLVTESPKGKLPYKAVGVIDASGNFIMIDSIKVNEILPSIIERIPSLKGYQITRREVRYENARFDFLLGKGPQKLLLEVKGCTLFWEDVASFPDAPTKRGVKHLRLLSNLPEDLKGGILFIIQKPVKYFIPNFHTDPEFASELYKARERLLIEAISLKWDEDLNLIEESVSRAHIPWERMEPLLQDKGAYLLLLLNESPKALPFSNGSKSKSPLFEKGFYVYVGSGLRGLSSRIKRHLSDKGKPFWHIDKIKKGMKVVKVIPIRNPERMECKIAKELKAIADGIIAGFGSSDCACESHLFYFKRDPRQVEGFLGRVLKFRFGLLSETIQNP
ncbi:MAG: DNA/RNA nuclease SfsA [Synergistetes bacterium]|nr:DNA/RNA nuclease SfsA [Synergistota bacterium]